MEAHIRLLIAPLEWMLMIYGKCLATKTTWFFASMQTHIHHPRDPIKLVLTS